MDRRFSAYDGGEGVEERGALCQDRLSEWCGQRPVAPAHDCSDFIQEHKWKFSTYVMFGRYSFEWM